MKGIQISGNRAWILWYYPTDGEWEFYLYGNFEDACSDIKEILGRGVSIDAIELYWIDGTKIRVLGSPDEVSREELVAEKLAGLVDWKHITEGVIKTEP